MLRCSFLFRFRRQESSQTVMNASPPSLPSIGPFLEILVKSIDGWLNNTVEVNLALCSIVSRLACYSHPLLRSLLLNPYLVLQPSVPSLVLSIATLKQRIDNALRVNDNAGALLEEARSEIRNLLHDGAKIEKPASVANAKGYYNFKKMLIFVTIFLCLIFNIRKHRRRYETFLFI